MSRSLTACGNGAPASHRNTVRGSRTSTSRAKRRTERPDALIAARSSSASVMASAMVRNDAECDGRAYLNEFALSQQTMTVCWAQVGNSLSGVLKRGAVTAPRCEIGDPRGRQRGVGAAACRFAVANIHGHRAARQAHLNEVRRPFAYSGDGAWIAGGGDSGADLRFCAGHGLALCWRGEIAAAREPNMRMRGDMRQRIEPELFVTMGAA